MKEIGNIFVVGPSANRQQIGELLSAAGLKVTQADKGYQAGMAKADLIIECLPDGLEAKQEAWREWEEKVPADAILATTALWGITALAGVTRRPEKTVGLNFIFNPVEKKCLVQIVKGLDTSDETVQTCQALLGKVGAQSILVKDSPGLVVDRPLAATINEAATMYVTGVASIEDIDKIAKSCLNWPMGPFEFADTIGVDRVLEALEILTQYEGSRFLPCYLLREMVAMNRLGKKTGRGFYTYG